MPKTQKIDLPTKLVSQARERLDGRGITLEEYLRLHLRVMVRTPPSILALTDEIPFGKYRGEIVEVVCRADPGYMTWMVAQNGKTQFGLDVLQLLSGLAE
jgi:hypothetical protein